MMQMFLAKGLRKVGRGFQRLGDRFAPPAPPPPPQVFTPQETARHIRLERWYAINGDQTLRVEYDLTPNSLVLDLGGYRGSWATEIMARYNCTVHIFEPCPEFMERIRLRLGRNAKIKLHPFGLAGETKTARLAIDGEGTSIYREFDRTVEIRLEQANDFFRREHMESIDLMKMNIEGGEYELLDHLIATGAITRIRDLAVQFHEDVIPNADQRMRELQAALMKTHHLTWQHEWVWENWRRND